MMTAHELGLADRITLLDPGSVSPIEPNAEITRHNPLGKIPCLVTNHGHPLYDSRVICEYLCHHAGDKTLLPDEPVRRFRILTLQALALGTAEAAVAWRYEMVSRPAEYRWASWADRVRSCSPSGIMATVTSRPKAGAHRAMCSTSSTASMRVASSLHSGRL